MGTFADVEENSMPIVHRHTAIGYGIYQQVFTKRNHHIILNYKWTTPENTICEMHELEIHIVLLEIGNFLQVQIAIEQRTFVHLMFNAAVKRLELRTLVAKMAVENLQYCSSALVTEYCLQMEKEDAQRFFVDFRLEIVPYLLEVCRARSEVG